MVAGVTTPYSTVAPMFGAPPSWVPTLEQERIQSYLVYEDIYWNNPNTFKVVARGAENSPIYVPTGRIIVDTINRYTGTGFDFMVDQTVGTPEQQALAAKWFTSLFRREKFRSKYLMNKRFGMIRGDWIWHITADPTKPPGRRISIRAVDPAAWFPVYDDDDLDRLVKMHIAEQYLTPEGKERIKRLTYEKTEQGVVLWSEAIYEVKDWELQDITQAETIVQPPTALPSQITAFPVYAIKNFEEPGNPYGASELRGLERIITAVNQAVSDEDLALALEGIGVYATDGGGPVDEDGNDAPWILGPGEVVENAINFRRVAGVGSLQPYGDHIDRLVGFMKDASTASDSAIGKIDVQVAESGVALALHLAPTLSKAEEKDQEILDVHTQMFYDLKAWFQAYEGAQFMDVDVLPILGEKLPVNKKQEVDMILQQVAAKVMSTTTARVRLAALGYEYAQDEAALIAADATLEAEAQAAADPFTARVNAELATLGGAEDSDTPRGNAAAE